MTNLKKKDMKTTIIIQNLKCGGCASTIKKELSKLTGVQNIEVNQDLTTVTYEYDSENNKLQVHDRLNELGYPLETDQNTLLKKAKSYASCVVGRIDNL